MNAKNSAHGLIALLKPPGMTSHDAVAHVRRVLKIKRVGHTGTLDPAAAGVLLICVGQATRLAEALQAGPKEYLAEATFGYETDTLDAVGRTIRECDAGLLSRSDVEQACATFRGDIQQQAPMHSAIKVGGQKLYEIARAGGAMDASINAPTRAVTISQLEVTRFFPGPRPRAFLRVECSAGTYIRSLVRDIGHQLGNAATMTFLSRLRNGGFAVEQSVTPQEFEQNPSLVALPKVLQQLYGSPHTDDGETQLLWQGQRIPGIPLAGEDPGAKSGQTALWSNIQQTIWVLARRENETQENETRWKPEKVFDLRAS